MINVSTGNTVIRVRLSNTGVQGASGIFRLNERVVDSGSSNAVLLADGTIVVLWNSASNAAKTQTIPTSTGSLQQITIMDFYGDSESNPITIAPVSGDINNILPSVEISTQNGSITLLDTSLGWVTQ